MKIQNYPYYKYLLILFTCCIVLCKSQEVFAFQKDSLGQIPNPEFPTEFELVETQEKKVEVYSAVREELHRYMGYEELLPKYVSLPYDVIMNTNIGNAFVDIGYFFLLFLPVLLLFGLKSRLLKMLTVLLLLLFLIVSLPTGYRSHNIITVDQVATSITKELGQTAFVEAPMVHLKLQLTQLANTIYLPIHYHIIEVFSGEGDAITYPIFFLFFLLAFFLLNNRLKESTLGIKAIPYFFLMYSFLWLILGAGVIWYGLLILPIGLILIGIDALNTKKDTNFFRYSFFIISTMWIISALAYRFSNYSLPLTKTQIKAGDSYETHNIGAINAAPLMYGMGRMEKPRLMEFLFPNYQSVLKIINNDPDALVYRVGTFFQYFIERNTDRVLEDNQIAYFDNLYNLVPDKLKLAAMLKTQRYKYLIIDFNIASIDRTPDESLTKKARRFNKFLQNNSSLQVIGTDRILLNKKGQKFYGITGGRILDRGTFVAFKIK